MILYLSVTFVVGVLAVFGWKLTARSAYESAEYTELESEGLFELRDYPDLMMATTRSKVEMQGNDGSFMRLFQYISGANDNEQKVAMTIPVFMEPDTRDDQGQMGFVIPKDISEQGAPDPSDDNVQIQRRIGGRFAVVRFEGRMNRELLAKEELKLRNWMSDKGLIGDDDAEFAGYDPPWTPASLRRNEILIRLN
ncbi:MAG: SOUL family heme-binding protein [Aeoliella sp.]